MTGQSSAQESWRGRLLVYAHEPGSAFRAMAVVVAAAAITAWVVGMVSSVVLVEGLGSAAVIVGVERLVRRVRGG